MVGDGVTITKILETVKEVKPLGMNLGTHQFVQMSEIDFRSTALYKEDLSTILWITPVGASVPPITSTNIKNIFPNMVVIIMFLLFVKYSKINITQLYIYHYYYTL